MAIISFGEALIDLLPADNDSSHCVKCAGGAPANVAVGVLKKYLIRNPTPTTRTY